MKRPLIAFLCTLIISVVFVGSASAASATDPETQLTTDAATVDETGQADGAGASVAQAIEAMFNVTASQVTALRADNLGYGEIVLLLSLAQTMPGGVTSDNIEGVLKLRQGPPVAGWGVIARSLGVKLGDLESAVAKARHDSTALVAQGQGASHRAADPAVKPPRTGPASTPSKPSKP